MANVTTLPQAILDRQSDVLLLATAKAAFLQLAPGFDTGENQFPHQMLEPFCILLAQAYIDLEDVERRTSLATATGADLDRLGDLYGVTRAPAAFAAAVVTFSGAIGSSIIQGTSVSTLGGLAQFFTTTAAATIPVGGTVNVPVIATLAGAAGNVGPNTITLLTPPVGTGITGVTNAAAAIDGADVEVDGPTGQYQTGYRADIHNLMDARGEGGAAKHIRKWARGVPGVGNVVVLEQTPQPGWVTIALLGSDLTPASPAVVQAVEATLLDPWYLTFEAESLLLGGFGAALDSQPDGTPIAGTNNTVKLVYNASGQGTVVQSTLQLVLPQAGIWRMGVTVKTGVVDGTGSLLQFGVWDVTNGTWAMTRPFGSIPANQILSATQVGNAFNTFWQDYAWDGVHVLEARVYRLVADTVSQLWLDQVDHFSTMSRADRDVGLTPAGMRLLVQAAVSVPINVAATLSYVLTGSQTQASVQAAAAANVVAYLGSIAFTKSAVRRASVEDAIFNTPGIADVASVTLNLGTANIIIPPTSVAVLGSATWS